MTLDTTIPAAPSYIQTYGIQVTVFPADQINRIEVWRAPQSGGLPNDGAAVQSTVLPPSPLGGVTFIDPLPSGTGPFYYKSRHLDAAGNQSLFTAYTEALTPTLIVGAAALNPMAAFGAIVDALPPSAKYEMRLASNYVDPDLQDGMQSYIDFVASTNFMRIGQTPLNILGSTAVNPSVVQTNGAHGYVTGDRVSIHGHLVNTAINNTTAQPSWSITYIDADHFSVPVLGIGGGGGVTGHVVRLSLTIGSAGDLSVFATIRAAVLNVLGLSSFSDVATFLGGALFRNTLQHSTAGGYGDTGFNRVLLNNDSLKVMGDAGTGTNNEAVRVGTHTVTTGVPTARTTANQTYPNSTNKGWAGGTSGGTDTMTRTTKGLVNESAGNLLFNRIGDPDGGDDGTATGSQSSTTLQDTSKTWTVNQYTGQEVRITGGTGSGQTRSIVSNTANTLTVAAWGTTPVSASSTYTIAGDNIDAYDDNYTLTFRVQADVGTLPLDFSITSTALVSYSLDGGTTWTQLSATYTALSVFGGGAVTNTFSPTVVVTGSPTQLRFRLDFSTTVLGPGAISGSATGSLFAFSSAFATNAYPMTWSTFVGTSKTRRGLKAFATTDGTDQQPHAYFEPLTAATPDANAGEGEIEYVGSTLHALGYHDDEKFRYVPRPVGFDLAGSTTAAGDTRINALGLKIKADKLNVLGRRLKIRCGGSIGANTGAVHLRLGPLNTVVDSEFLGLTLASNEKWVFDIELVVQTPGSSGTARVSGITVHGTTIALVNSTFTLNTTTDLFVTVSGSTAGGVSLVMDLVTVDHAIFT